MSIKDEREAYLERLNAITVERQLQTSDDAKNPETIAWCLTKLQQGVSMDELRHKLGVPDTTDYRWRVMRREIQRAQEPSDENQALIDYYVEIEEEIETLKADRAQIQEKIDGGPQSDKDSGYYSLFKAKNDTTKTLIEAKHSKYQNFLDKKRVKQITGKYSGAKITIISNIPRPGQLVEAVKTVQEILGDDDE